MSTREDLFELLVAAAEPDHPDHERAWSELFRDRLFALVRLADTEPRAALGAVRAALSQSERIGGGACYRVQLLGIQAQAERSLGDLDAATASLDEAWELSAGCALARLEVLRRRGILLAAQGRCELGLAALDGAVAGYERLGSPGHNLHGDGLGWSRQWRAHVLHLMDENAKAMEDLHACLSGTPPRSVLYRYTLINLARALYSLGPETRLEAFRHLRRARSSYKGDGRRSVERAYLDWVEALLRIDLRYGKRAWALKLLTHAQKTFAWSGMPAETLAVTADIARIQFPDFELIKKNLGALLPRLRELRIPPASFQLVDDLWVALKPEAPSVEQIDGLISDLRRVVADEPGVVSFLLVHP